MDRAEKHRLKQLGKEIVAKRSEELRRQLATTNPAPFASDEYLRNEIEIREKERSVRADDRVYTADEIREHFVVRPQEFDLRGTYPAISGHFWQCGECGDVIPTITGKRLICTCENICVDGISRDFRVRDEGALRLVRLLGRVRVAREWWQVWKPLFRAQDLR
jgi:hypothetical protein